MRRAAPRVRRHRATPAGTSLPEMLAVLILTAIVLAMAVPRMRYGIERAAVRGAVADVVATLSAARQIAVSSGGGVAVSVDGPTATVRVTRHGDTVVTRPLGQMFGVRLQATRDSLAYDARGLGAGAANLTFVIVRGITTDTVVVSRLGRVRW
jgi:Tfp pilus assembly protein FimT